MLIVDFKSRVEAVHHNRQVPWRPAKACVRMRFRLEATSPFIERSRKEMALLVLMNESQQGCTGTASTGMTDESLHLSLPWARCCSGLLRGLHQGVLGRVGRAGIGVVLSRRGGCCFSDGVHQQYLGMLCWLCRIQVLLHASHHHHNVSSL